jgi:hypothetical protein
MRGERPKGRGFLKTRYNSPVERPFPYRPYFGHAPGRRGSKTKGESCEYRQKSPLLSWKPFTFQNMKKAVRHHFLFKKLKVRIYEAVEL